MEYIVSNRSAFADQTPTISDESSNTRMVQIQLIPPHSPHMTTAHEDPITSQFNIFIAHAAITGYHKLLSTILFPVIWTHPQLPQPILRNTYVFNPVSTTTTPQAYILCQIDSVLYQPSLRNERQRFNIDPRLFQRLHIRYSIKRCSRNFLNTIHCSSWFPIPPYKDPFPQSPIVLFL